MRSAFGRAVVVAGAVVIALGSAAGAAAKPRPPVLTFSPAPYNYGQVAAGGAASQTFTLANTGGQGTGRLRVTLAGAAAINEARLNTFGPTTLISGQASPWGVAVDSGHIYWANSGDGTIKEAPLTGGPVTTLVTGQISPVGVAVSP